jgi:uncharacterized protein YndB with AHSA1/START domain
MGANNKGSVEPGFIVRRIVNAPRKLVWKAWTEADRLSQWWGPKGFTMRVVKLDLRPGGMFHYGMQSPDGKQLWGKFVYREIVPPERIVFVVSFSDEQGGATRHWLSDTWPMEVLNIVTFTEDNGKTTIRLSGSPVNATEEEVKTYRSAFQGMEQGFKGTFDQLEEYLAISRKGDAK